MLEKHNFNKLVKRICRDTFSLTLKNKLLTGEDKDQLLEKLISNLTKCEDLYNRDQIDDSLKLIENQTARFDIAPESPIDGIKFVYDRTKEVWIADLSRFQLVLNVLNFVGKKINIDIIDIISQYIPVILPSITKLDNFYEMSVYIAIVIHQIENKEIDGIESLIHIDDLEKQLKSAIDNFEVDKFINAISSLLKKDLINRAREDQNRLGVADDILLIIDRVS
ncbi:MAG: hypothetical protein GY839_02060 [candidate division Zixibacteria bacterium]|nr:hypothetical protein [candidate division Zixibacteria bacterium]